MRQRIQMARQQKPEDFLPLTAVVFEILLALASGERHGYAIMQEIERRAGEPVPIGAGTLYRTIKQLVDAELILEVKPRRVVHRQRRTYRLTSAGRKRASVAAQRLDSVVRWAQSVAVIEKGRA